MNPIATYFLVKEAGWRRIARREAVKNAFSIKDLLSGKKLLGGAQKAVPYAGLALGAGGIGYNLFPVKGK